MNKGKKKGREQYPALERLLPSGNFLWHLVGVLSLAVGLYDVHALIESYVVRPRAAVHYLLACPWPEPIIPSPLGDIDGVVASPTPHPVVFDGARHGVIIT